MDGGIGTRYEVDADGAFTGSIDGPFVYGEGKVEAMRRFAESTRSTSPPPTPTRTRLATCRCCAPSATRWSSTPMPTLAEIAREEGWQVMRFEKLGRRLAIAGATVARGGRRRGALASKRRQGGRSIVARGPLRR